MPIDDLWFKTETLEDDSERTVPSERHGRGKRWRVRWEDPDTTRTRTKAFARKPDAIKFDNETQADLARGQFIDPQLGRTSVEDWAEQWRRQRIQRPGTQEVIERAIRLHVVPVLGRMPLMAVRSGTIRDWVQGRRNLEKPLAASTIRGIYFNVVRPMFEQAAIDRMIARTPCVGIQLPELPPGVYDLPTPDQVYAVCAELPDRYKAPFLLAAGCGWRSGEVFGLEDDAVDFLKRKVEVRHQLRELSRGAPHIAPPKSRTSRRTNELPDFSLNALSEHLRMFPVQETEIADRTNPDREKVRVARLLFLDDKGRPMRRSEWSKILRAAAIAAKVPVGLVTMRILRHYFATVLIYAGRNVKTVQMACGHATPTITLNTYLGYWPEDTRDSTRDLMEDALGAGFTRSVLALAGV